MERPEPPRLAPLADDEWDDDTRAAIERFMPAHRRNLAGMGNALATLFRHPALTESFMTFNLHLLTRSTLPARLRELVILRVARKRGCDYEWHHHTRIGAKAGLSPAEIEAAGRGDADDALEAAALTAVDELDHDSKLSDATWATLAEHLDERQRMDLVFTIGTYTLLASAFNTFGVEPEHER